MFRTTVVIILLLLGLGPLGAQKLPNKGVPPIQNYLPAVFGEAGKAWSIQSTPNGLVYFATDQGLLEFDGANWQLFSGSKGFTRSLLFLNDSTAYSGADKDFGRWQRNPLQQFRYTSLNPYRESAKGLNQEFWGTYRIDNDLIFVSFDNLYVYREERLTQLPAPTRFTGSFSSGGQLYVVDQEEGIFQFNGLRLTQLTSLEAAFSEPPTIVGIQEEADYTLIITRKQGVYRFVDGRLMPEDYTVTPALKRDQVFSFTAIDTTHYAFGTIRDGVYITDRSGNIIHHVNKQKGLLNNTVLSLHYSPQGTLWLGLDFGIAAVDLWSDVSYFLDQQGKVGTGYTAVLYEKDFYLGTNQGLYLSDWEALNNDREAVDFQLITGSSGQVWDIKEVAGDLLCAHDQGLFTVSNSQLIPLSKREGVLTITAIDDDYLMAGTYNGVALYQKKNNRWQYVRKLTPLQGACNQIVRSSKDNIWVNIPRFGVINARLEPDFSIREQTIFPYTDFGETPVEILRSGDTIVACTKDGQFIYQPAAKTFTTTTPSPTRQQVRHRLPERHTPVQLDESYGFHPVHNGFALTRTEKVPPPPTTPALILRGATAISEDTTINFAAGTTLPQQQQNLQFRFISPNQPAATYQYRLIGHTDIWSKWSTLPYANFIELAAGEYTFVARAKVMGNLTDEHQFPFRITAPWYQNTWAYLLFGIGLAGLLYLNRQWRKRALRQQKKQLLQQEQTARQERAWLAGQQNMQKRYETLEDALEEAKKQLRSKTIKLAKKAKETEERGRLLQALKKKIETLEDEATSNKFRFSQISRMLEGFPDGEDNSFDLQMEELNKAFLAKLSQQFPKLTTYDLRLSTYLKAGLNTREIANHLNVLPSSVNVSRSRLRKKLQLDSKTDLYKFLNGL